MKRIYTCLALFIMLLPIHANVYNMKELGADNSGNIICTALINETILKAHQDGGGTLYFPAGTYLTATIRMKSNIELHLEAGATIRFSDHFEDYLPFEEIRWEGTVMNTLTPLIYARNEENLSITGRGTLDGNGFKWWTYDRELSAEIRKNGKLSQLTDLQKMWVESNKDLVVEDYYKKSLERKFFRPPFIQFFECNNILIENIKIINSPFWTINPAFCDTYK